MERFEKYVVRGEVCIGSNTWVPLGTITIYARSQDEANHAMEETFRRRIRNMHPVSGMSFEWLEDGENIYYRKKKFTVMVPESIHARVKESHHRLHELEG